MLAHLHELAGGRPASTRALRICNINPYTLIPSCRPIYTSSLEGGLLASDLRVAEDLRNAFEEVFFQYEVDMTWAGAPKFVSRPCSGMHCFASRASQPCAALACPVRHA